MSKFLDEVLGDKPISGVTPVLEGIDEPITEDVEVIEEVAPIIEETAVEEVAIEETPKAKKEIDYKGFLDENEDAVFNYLKEKRTDYSSYEQADLVKMKIKADNPEYDDDDVEAEMADKYGVGLEKIEIDEDEMTLEEISEAKAHNKSVDSQIKKGTRELKKDATQASKYFQDNKNSFELPKFQVNDEVETTESFSQEDFQATQNAQYTEYKEKTWIPQLKDIIEPFEGIKKQVEYEDNGNKVVLDVDYKLSKQEKEEIQSELSDYVSQVSDSKYLKEDKTADLQRFVSDKIAEKFHDKLLKTVAKEAAARARKEFVKNDLLNFDDGIRDRAPANSVDNDFASDFFTLSAQASKKQL